MSYNYSQTLYLIRGLPGSGKTIFAHNFTGLLRFCNEPIEHFEADMYFTDGNGQYFFDPKHLGTAHLWCQNRTFEELESGFENNVIVSNTFTTNKELKPYFDMVDQINSFRVEKGIEDLIRINVIHLENDFGSIHNVPSETIEKMRSRWEPLRLKQRLEF